MTITEFLTARLDEDEERAGSGWSRLSEERWERDNYGQSMLTPRAVLAEVEAKRRMVADAEAAFDAPNVDEYGDHTGPLAGERATWRDVLHYLALPYADHPDYDEAWRV